MAATKQWQSERSRFVRNGIWWLVGNDGKKFYIIYMCEASYHRSQPVCMLVCLDFSSQLLVGYGANSNILNEVLSERCVAREEWLIMMVHS